MARLVLDTSVWAKLQRGGEDPRSRVDVNDHVFLPTVVLAELKVGAKHRSRTEKHRRETEAFIRSCLEIAEFQPATQLTAEIFAELSAYTISVGKPRGQNDLWIAASAIELRAELVTLDRRARFEGLPGLVLRD